ncbi:MAG: glycosyltransferase family 2 protein [Fidelibacterota bacterium]
MKVSIIVSIFNGADILPITIPPLLSQDYPAEQLEIILVDDASTDSTPQLLDNPKWQKQCLIIRHEKNRGRPTTRNSGIKAASGELLIFMDCDIEVSPSFVSKHVRYYRNEQIVGVLSNLRPNTRNLRDKYHRYLFEGKRGAKLIPREKPLPFKYFILTCTSIRKEAVIKTGYFNEKLPGYGIDLEYAYRLWENYPQGLFHAPEIEVKMHKLKTLNEAMKNFHEFGEKNLPVILEKFPELAPFVGADFIVPGRLSWKRFVGMILMHPFNIYIAKFKLKLVPFPLSNIFVRYLLVASTAIGYKFYLRQHG